MFYEKTQTFSFLTMSKVRVISCQNGKRIQQIFKSQNKGIYIDIGCGHPIKNNNTYLLNKKGSSGINIDLDIDNYYILVRKLREKL